MTNNLEEIVQLVLRAYYEVHEEESIIASTFELELRKMLMQRYCNNTSILKQHTYTITPGDGVMGKWTTKDCPPNVDYTAKQILNG